MSEAEASNPSDHRGLIQQWVMEWRVEAKKNGSKIEYTYMKALKSIRECRDPISCGADCKKLKGFGDKTCASVDKKLKEHFGPGFVIPEPRRSLQPAKTTKRKVTSTPGRSIQRIDDILAVTRGPLISPSINSPLRKITKYSRLFVPAEGSSSFAILVSLLRYDYEYDKKLVNRLDLEDMAQRYASTSTLCGTSFQKFAGWNSSKTLLNRELVGKTDDRRAQYYLTDTGKDLAINLAKASSKLKEFVDRFLTTREPINSFDSGTTINDDIETEPPSSQETASALTSNIMFTPGSYEIILYIDSRERYATNFCSENRAAFVTALQKQGIKSEIRTLPLGDFVWVAREKSQYQAEVCDLFRFQPITSDLNSQASTASSSTNEIRRELVLDHIIERKRVDDLASSIKDRRWEEQKFRLKKCGIRRPCYLIEYNGKQSRKQDVAGVKREALDQAIVNAEIDGFQIKITNNFEETIRYLTFTHRWLDKAYQNKTLFSVSSREALRRTEPGDYCYITFNEFASNSGKITTYTTQEMFIIHFLVVRGLSLAKAKAIVERYSTLNKLMLAYQRAPDLYSKHNLLTDIPVNSLNGLSRKIGPMLSRKLSFLYTSI